MPRIVSQAQTATNRYPQQTAPRAPVPVHSQRSIVTEEGDTLQSLADNYYGNPAFWTRIYNANLNRIASPGAVRPGQTLIIP